MLLTKMKSLVRVLALMVVVVVNVQGQFDGYGSLGYGLLPAHYRINPFFRYHDPLVNLRSDHVQKMTLGDDSDAQIPLISENSAPVSQAVASTSQNEIPGLVTFLRVTELGGYGTLITTRHVLTSGDCATILERTRGTVRAYLNTATLFLFDSTTEIRSVRNIYIHPNYATSPRGFSVNNVAVIRLDLPVRTVLPIALSTGSLVAGDSFTTYKYSSPFMSELDGVIDSDCGGHRQDGGNLNGDQFICSKGVPQSCKFEGGQPMMRAGVQYALSASDRDAICFRSAADRDRNQRDRNERNKRAVFVRIAPFIDWIAFVTDL